MPVPEPARVAHVVGWDRDAPELEEIVGELLADKSELVRIAQAYEQELVAQQISADDIEYISTNFVPLLKQVMEKAGASGASGQEIIDLLQPILSVETVTVLQLIGFNFRKGIGEPLTELVSRAILSKAARRPGVATPRHNAEGIGRSTMSGGSIPTGARQSPVASRLSIRGASA